MSTGLAKIGFISLGCPKALVDSERIITQLRAEGYIISPTYEDSDLVIINTCGFIDAAVEESLGTIEEALNENGNVIVTGCLGAREEVIRDKFPSVIAITGPHDTEGVMQVVHEHLPIKHHEFTSLVPPQGIKLTPPHFAYLKISEGCNHRCTFCIIPGMRGDLVSRDLSSIMREAENLVASGVKELLVVAQDTSAYGLDIKYQTAFWNGRPVKSHITELASSLGELGAWVRMHYIYPYPHVDQLIPLMADGKIVPYLDIPFQHASMSVLKAMKRPAHAEKVLDRIHQWREICPDITLRSTFITGFPGETEEDFQILLDFLDEAQLDHAGCFMYSPVEGAEANKLPGQVPEELKQERLERFMEKQAEISALRLERYIDRTIPVIVDHIEEEAIIARGQKDAPEIDGNVILPNQYDLSIGDIVDVKIQSSDEYDLYGELVNQEKQG
jgi:ribosomal protein S12 methylthiotransferase